LLLQAAPTIVMTQRGARKHFQQFLRSKGVEVIEFDFLTPDAVADYCYERGFLQVIKGLSGSVTLLVRTVSSGAALVLHTSEWSTDHTCMPSVGAWWGAEHASMFKLPRCHYQRASSC
jgi:hypothetical protein